MITNVIELRGNRIVIGNGFLSFVFNFIRNLTSLDHRMYFFLYSQQMECYFLDDLHILSGYQFAFFSREETLYFEYIIQ